LKVQGTQREGSAAAMFRNRAVRGVLLGFALLAPWGLSGCNKKAQAVVLPKATAPVALATPPAAPNPPLVEPQPSDAGPTPTAEAAANPTRERRRPAPKPAATAPVQIASNESAAESSGIGELTVSGDEGSQGLQEATELIASNDKRLKALPAATVSRQRSQISKIRNFQRHAQEALKSGDVEGAKTLATKARLLLYDLDRGAGE
jgi:hypothetical protein